jgi:hypothetical protein
MEPEASRAWAPQDRGRLARRLRVLDIDRRIAVGLVAFIVFVCPWIGIAALMLLAHRRRTTPM